MDPEIYNIEKYSECFSSLHTAKKLGVPAPHKAVLLLSVDQAIPKDVIDKACQLQGVKTVRALAF